MRIFYLLFFLLSYQITFGQNCRIKDMSPETDFKYEAKFGELEMRTHQLFFAINRLIIETVHSPAIH